MQVRGRNLFFSTDTEAGILNADIIFVSVNTPTKTYGIGEGSAADVRNVELAARLIGSIAKTPKIVVEKSTVPVKTGETITRVLNATGSTCFLILFTLVLLCQLMHFDVQALATPCYPTRNSWLKEQR